MGFLDKMRGAVAAVTGGAAKVSLEYNPATAFPGELVNVKITAISTGGEVKSKGVFVDLLGTEEINIQPNSSNDLEERVHDSNETVEQAFQIAPAFVLAANETKIFEGSFQIPGHCQPSYQGRSCGHEWQIRGRIEAFGNDPDSGFLPIRVGLKN
jgi:sporulation-control protein spo0M